MKTKKISKTLNFEDLKMSQRELDAIRPREPMCPSELVKLLRVPIEENAMGRFDMNLTPYLIQPLKTLANYDIENVFIIGPTQSGKTVIAQTCVAWAIDQDPGPMLYTYPDELTAEKALDKKIGGMIKSTPFLRRHIHGKRSITKQGIITDTMSIDIAWSNSAATMNVLPKKRVIGDEIRLFKLTIGQESNAVKMMQDRLTTYLDLEIGQGLFISSPSVEGDLLHTQLDVPGTMINKWWVPCLQCGKFQILDFFENVKRPDKKGVVRCLCKYCGGEFSDNDRKQSWNNLGVYAPSSATVSDDGTVTLPENMQKECNRIVYWWTSLDSPFRNFTRIWEEFEKTKDKPQDYKNFIQCWLAQFWKIAVSKGSVDKLKTNKQDYLIGEVPEDAQVLIGGIDTQDDSLYIVIYALGKSKIWLISEDKILCDMGSTSEEDLYDIVIKNVVGRDFYTTSGVRWRVGIVAWDSGGHRTKEVYAVTKRIPNVIAIKGRNTQTRSISYSTKETHYNIRTEEYLEETESLSATDRFYIPQNVSLQFLIQFVNLVKTINIHKRTGRKKLEWISRGPDHLRHASAYAFCCLDIPISKIGTLRSRIKDINFKYNPAILISERLAKKENKTSPLYDNPFEEHDNVKSSRNDFF